MSSVRRMALQVIVGAVDNASKVLRSVASSTSRLGKHIQKVRGEWRMFSEPTLISRIAHGFNNVAESVIAVGTRMAALGTVAAVTLGAIVQRVTSAGDKTIKFARQIGINVERLQEWRYAAEQAGIPAESFDKALAKLGLRAAQARAGVGEAREYFKALGISMTDAAGNGRKLEELLPEIADKIAAIQDPNARGVFLAKFFDDEGVALERMLNKGSRGLAEMASHARALGVVASAETLTSFERFQSTVGALKAQFSGLTTELVAKLLPAVSKLADALSAFLAANQENLAKWVQHFVDAFTVTIPAIVAELRSTLEPVLNWIGEKLAWVWELIKPTIDGIGELLGLLARWSGVTGIFERAGDRVQDQLEERRRSGLSLDQKIDEFLYPGGYGKPDSGASPGELKVSFANAPAGLRIERDRAARRMVNLDVGYAMPGVGMA